MVKFIVWIYLVRREKTFRAIEPPDMLIPILGRKLVLINSHSLLSELCDEKRFPKFLSAILKEGYPVVHDGLFTYADCTPFQPQLNSSKFA